MPRFWSQDTSCHSSVSPFRLDLVGATLSLGRLADMLLGGVCGYRQVNACQPWRGSCCIFNCDLAGCDARIFNRTDLEDRAGGLLVWVWVGLGSSGVSFHEAVSKCISNLEIALSFGSVSLLKQFIQNLRVRYKMV